MLVVKTLHVDSTLNANRENVKSESETAIPPSNEVTESIKPDHQDGHNENQDSEKTKVKFEDHPDKHNDKQEINDGAVEVKPKKRGRGAKGSRGRHSLDSSITQEVRRSGRVRKPVEFLTMEVLQPKRVRQSSKPTNQTPTTEAQTNGANVVTKKKRRSKKLEEEPTKKKKKKSKRKRRHGKKSRGSYVWLSATSSSESDDDDAFERALLEHDLMSVSDTADTNGNKPDALDWLDKPESDFNPDELSSESDVDSLTLGRNFARQKRLERMRAAEAASVLASNNTADETCQVCGKAHEPEWILLCDRCDKGHHAMCLCPPLFFIPEGDWFCPRCQHATLLEALAECADQIDAEQKKQTIWKRMQERLNFVNISMTNILADGDEEDGDNGGRRRARSTANMVYRDSYSSQEDVDGENEDASQSNSGESATPYRTDGSDSASETFGGRRITSRRAARHARLVNGLNRTERRSAASRRARNRWLSGSESEEETSSSSASFAPPAPRAARQRPVQYDLGEAFKQLDEALEDDEKYQEEKRRRRNRRLNREEESGSPRDLDAPASPSSGPPPGRSRGKDLSNIMGPNWESRLELDRPSRSRKRRAGVLSSSSTDSEEQLPVPGNTRKRKMSSDDAEDADFRPSGSSEELSEQSEDVDETGSTSESDSSWLCAARRRNRKMGKRGPRVANSGRKRSKYLGRRRGRPVPRFEQSEDEELLDDVRSPLNASKPRPRRCESFGYLFVCMHVTLISLLPLRKVSALAVLFFVGTIRDLRTDEVEGLDVDSF
ncbi:unnamed protein product [Echinostoma caproni]|uniref:PHD-type domain-containing protein n=1 Tax=Echinostoma caproni TaxID=27848 RepID=A0A183B592_9TREM|nr:unnamed protein product [Echinostoma caproni]